MLSVFIVSCVSCVVQYDITHATVLNPLPFDRILESGNQFITKTMLKLYTWDLMDLKIHSSKRTTSLAALVVNKVGGGDNNHENRVKHPSNVNADSQNYTPQKSSDSSNRCPRKSKNSSTGRKGKLHVVCL